MCSARGAEEALGQAATKPLDNGKGQAHSLQHTHTYGDKLPLASHRAHRSKLGRTVHLNRSPTMGCMPQPSQAMLVCTAGGRGDPGADDGASPIRTRGTSDASRARCLNRPDRLGCVARPCPP